MRHDPLGYAIVLEKPGRDLNGRDASLEEALAHVDRIKASFATPNPSLGENDVIAILNPQGEPILRWSHASATMVPDGGLVGWQIVDDNGFSIHGTDKDPFGTNSFSIIMDEAVATARAWASNNPEYTVAPVMHGDIEEPEYLDSLTVFPEHAGTMPKHVLRRIAVEVELDVEDSCNLSDFEISKLVRDAVADKLAAKGAKDPFVLATTYMPTARVLISVNGGVADITAVDGLVDIALVDYDHDDDRSQDDVESALAFERLSGDAESMERQLDEAREALAELVVDEAPSL